MGVFIQNWQQKFRIIFVLFSERIVENLVKGLIEKLFYIKKTLLKIVYEAAAHRCHLFKINNSKRKK